MNTRRQTIFILLVLVFFPAGLSAQETRYVTDRLSLGLFENEKASGKRITTLDSGASLEVLEQIRSFAKVRTVEGDVGWVKSAFLVAEKPAIVKVSELESEYQKQALKLDECRASQTEPPIDTTQKINTLEKALDSKEKQLKNARTRIDRLVQQISKPKEKLDGYEYWLSSYSFLWYLVGAIAIFITGVFIGIHIVNNRLRKRLYGFKLA